ncbi:SDR family NAD(P)-dependent oxidoreductase [Streptomyces sp. NPDC088801]|uniref:SDR family NAD(P)-dependent oxidoreductase n=1 Tax=Streptomyces sp. NPDC088801 TaxID=3365903 RepID=UPI003806580C
MSTRIERRTAVVTGAGNGLGRAIALALDAAGATVILVGRTESTLAETQRLLTGPALTLVADTSDEESVAALTATLAEEDVSILVNNAGVAGPVAPLWQLEVKDWDEVFDVNVRGLFLLCRALVPTMIERGDGDIINIASVSGKRPLARRTPYTASKMAVIGLSRTLAAELGPYGVRVNTLSPGPVDGPRMDRNFRLEAERTGSSVADAEMAFVSRAAMQRMVTEAEVADAALAMLTMTGMTGADIDLSAGMVAP